MKLTSANSDWGRRLFVCAISAAAVLAIPILFNGYSKPQTIMREAYQQSQTNQFKTPSDLLRELRISLLKDDEALFLKCFVEADSFQQCLQKAFRTVQATLRFRDAVVSLYGREGWEQFQQLGTELGTRPRLTPNVVPTEEEWWNGLEIQTQGEQAVFFNPVTQMTNVIVKSSTGWKIDARSAFGHNVDPVKLARYLKSTADAIEEMTSEMRTKRMPISDLGYELFQKAAAKRSEH